MAKIQVMGVKRGDQLDTIQIVLVNEVKEGDKIVSVPIGEAFIPFPHGTKLPAMKKAIVESARGIMAKHREALQLRQQLEKQEFPEIEE